MGAITGIQTQINRIKNEVDEQTLLIDDIIETLEGKAAGGNAEPTLQSKTVSPSTSSQIVKPDTGYDGLSQVTVNAMAVATQATPSISVSSSGLITASATQTAGYVSAGTKTGTKQLTTQDAKTVTPTESSQTAVSSDVYTTGAITVGPIPSSYVKPSGTLSIKSNGVYNVANYSSASVNVGEGDDGDGGSSSNLPIVGDTGFMNSSAEGKIIYTMDSSDGIIFVNTDLMYFNMTKKYRYPLDATILVDTPIIVLTTGTVTMPTSTVYALETIATGTGYSIFRYTVSDGPIEEEIPGL